MSEVLTIKAGAKRDFDSMEMEGPTVSCQQRTIKFLSPQKEIKRTRLTKEARDFNSIMKRLRAEPYAHIFTPSDDKRSGIVDKHIGRKRGSSSNEKLYSFDDVKELVRNTLRDRECELEKEFHSHLIKSLDEQSEQFIKFSEAYIAKQFKNSSEMSYVS